MKNDCLHNEGLHPEIYMKPYYTETRMICSKCNEVVQTTKTNNLISSYIATQDPTKPIQIGNDMYELSSDMKKVLNDYEKKFDLINQIAGKLPEGQKDPAVLSLLDYLVNETYAKLSELDCLFPNKSQLI